ncbi:MAG: PadR family transcriptional regulator [Actinomycetota bacterium]|jgi:DNA-binding PadR family transcriptional regulator|nr:PadR family transcriptional regulator [Actinomycetota bacterium]
MRTEHQPRCRCRLGPGSFEVRARVERFAEPAVLLLLAEGPNHGYGLANELEELLEEGRVDFGNLYRLLRLLEGEGLVSSLWSEDAPGPLKRTYELTAEGAALLRAWAASLRSGQARIAALLARYEAVVGKLDNADNRRERQ